MVLMLRSGKGFCRSGSLFLSCLPLLHPSLYPSFPSPPPPHIPSASQVFASSPSSSPPCLPTLSSPPLLLSLSHSPLSPQSQLWAPSAPRVPCKQSPPQYLSQPNQSPKESHLENIESTLCQLRQEFFTLRNVNLNSQKSFKINQCIAMILPVI